ncbi:aldose epimerase family protein [Variovorax sp. PBL-E5]|uniref:aldose epimerase family protein n=1 Tax=Variovorax sp. PBL-E5 TaxID=434014 RepID=UPI0013180CB1|nr:aldose 1-epimerase [Variovorax sp. PBL-E5]VTU15964.1 putative aldose-1-epimerase [Variovorax sp. PBL-E5]
MARLHVSPEIVLRCDRLRALLAPAAGGRITALRSTGLRGGSDIDWLVPLADAVRADGFESTAWPKAGCYPLVPFSNRIRAGRFSWNGRQVRLPIHPGEAHALHGGSQQMPWQLIQHEASSATMEYRHAAGAAGWPWAFRARQHIALDENGMTLGLRITNDSGETMPCGCGFHPYVPDRFGHRLRFDARTVWPPDAEFLATAPRPPEAHDDYAIPRALHNGSLTQYYSGCSGPVELEAADGHRIRIETDEVLSHRVLHRPSPEAGSYFCVEPVSHVADAANLMQQGRTDTGWHLLAAGEIWECRLRLRIEPA